MRPSAVIATAWLPASSAAAQSPGSAAKAVQTATRATTAAPTAASLLIAVAAGGQVENCVGEGSLSLGTLRTSFLRNLFHVSAGCERRRDARTPADFGDLDAAKARLCQDKANRCAYAAASHPCALKPKPGEAP